MNKLDLAKVGKAFGFAVPPRVNISIGGGKSGKRKREDESEDEEDGESERKEPARGGNGSKERERRIERLGKRKVEKEVFRNRKKSNWAR